MRIEACQRRLAAEDEEDQMSKTVKTWWGAGLVMGKSSDSDAVERW